MEQAIFFIILAVFFIMGISIAFGKTTNFLAQHRTFISEHGKWRVIRVIPEHSHIPRFIIEEKKRILWFSYWQEIVRQVEYRPGKFTEESIEYTSMFEAQRMILNQLAKQK